jgi:hypothetical protein
MKDREFLMWIHERLEHVHEENPCMDYMYKLRALILATNPEQETQNRGQGQHSLGELKKKMGMIEITP